jgi:protein-tyrosine-phosphatase
MKQRADADLVVFLCVHNAGRSQMAAALMERYADGALRVRSGGSDPADAVNPAVVEAMAEMDVDLSTQTPRRWTMEDLDEAEVIVTMGCGDECPLIPGKRYIDWQLDDPAGKSVDEVRPIRDEIDERVRALLNELWVAAC